MIHAKMEKLIHGGQALGRNQNKIVLAYNALPDEEVLVKPIKIKKNFITGIAVDFLKQSRHRINPVEKHFISCSPWQIIKYEYELLWKIKIFKDIFKKFASIEIKDVDIDNDNNIYGYRNKIEYSFISKNNELKYAFFKRGSHELLVIDECILAKKTINNFAKKVLFHLDKEKIKPEQLKTLVIRSNKKNDILAALFVKDKNFSIKKLDLNDNENFSIFYSDPKNSACTPDKLLYSINNHFITEKIIDTTLKFDIFSFFQVNIDVFEHLISDISKKILPEYELVDFYSGVGTISLALNIKNKNTTLVEINEKANIFAQENIKINQKDNFTSYCIPAKKAINYINNNSILILDPPRAGLDKKVIKKILHEKPPQIVYISCNIATQARDINLIKNYYNITFCKLYNFFPRTPHIESCIVLNRE